MMNDQDWQKLDSKQVYKGYRNVVRTNFRMPNGKTIDYDIIDEGRAVCVLALTANQQVVLAKQFRPGQNKILLELPGGGAKKDEDPLDAIKRELLEETGYTGNFQFVSTSWHSAYSTLQRYNFVATNCVKVAEPDSGDEEFTEVVLMSLSEFREHLRSGELTDMGTGYRCLDFLHLL
ncbi:NUDIX hydrolase [Patescibacteria group bacterium]|nr:NUDIX hydrolase [Patescibacteria group bacterium]